MEIDYSSSTLGSAVAGVLKVIHVIPHTRRSHYADQFQEREELLQRLLSNRSSAGVNQPQTDTAQSASLFPDEDTPLAIHLMRLDDIGSLLGAVKLNPSEFRPAGATPDEIRAMQALPIAGDSWDVYDICFRKTPEIKQTFFKMMLGILEFSLTWGIKSLNFLLDEDLQLALLLLPLAADAIDDPIELNGTNYTPIAIRVSGDAVRAVRALTKTKSPQLLMATDTDTSPPLSPLL